MYFLNLRSCKIFFFAVWFDAIVFWNSFYSAFSSFDLSIESVWSILSFASLMVLSQNVTIWFISKQKTLSGWRIKFSINCWPKFPIVGSSVNSKPFGKSLFLMIWKRKFLWETYFADFSFSQFSLVANLSVLYLWPKVGAIVKNFRLLFRR